MIRVSIDETVCTGHGRCYALSPDLFDIDDDGTGIAPGDPISVSASENAQLAVDNCPEEAIRLVRVDGA